VALIAVLGFNPRFWAAKDNVLSDLPFPLFFYVVLLMVRFAPRDSSEWLGWSLLAAVALYLCIGTRAAGLTLVPGLLLCDWITRRKLTRSTAATISFASILLVLQRYLAEPGQGSYFDQFHPTLAGVIGNIAS